MPRAANRVSSVGKSMPVGRKRRSARKVQSWTASPARWAWSTRRVGSPRAPFAVRGMTRSLCGASTCAYVEISRRPGRLDQVGVRAAVAGAEEVVRRALGVDQLHQRHPRHHGQPAQTGRLERLHHHLVVAQPQGQDPLGQQLLQRQSEPAEVRRVLDLRDDADRPSEPQRLPPGEGDHVVERGDLLQPVVRRVARTQTGHPLPGPQGPQFGVGEVLDEPAGDRGAVDDLGELPVREDRVAGDVRRTGDLVLVPADQDAVEGGDQVGLQIVGALGRGQAVRRRRVFRAVATRSPMRDHQHGPRTGAGHGPAGTRCPTQDEALLMRGETKPAPTVTVPNASNSHAVVGGRT